MREQHFIKALALFGGTFSEMVGVEIKKQNGLGKRTIVEPKWLIFWLGHQHYKTPL